MSASQNERNLTHLRDFGPGPRYLRPASVFTSACIESPAGSSPSLKPPPTRPPPGSVPAGASTWRRTRFRQLTDGASRPRDKGAPDVQRAGPSGAGSPVLHLLRHPRGRRGRGGADVLAQEAQGDDRDVIGMLARRLPREVDEDASQLLGARA